MKSFVALSVLVLATILGGEASAYDIRLAVESGFSLEGVDSPIVSLSSPIVDGSSVYFMGRATDYSTQGIFKWTDGSLSMVLDARVPLPGGESIWQTGGARPELLAFKVSDGGMAALFESPSGEQGLFFDNGSGYAKIAQSGDADPAGNGVYNSFGSFAVSGGRTVFNAVVDTGETQIIHPDKPPVPVLAETLNRYASGASTVLVDPSVTVPETGVEFEEFVLVEAVGEKVVFTCRNGPSQGIFAINGDGAVNTIISDQVLVDGVSGWQRVPGEVFPGDLLTVTEDRIIFRATPDYGTTIEDSLFIHSGGETYVEFTGDRAITFPHEFKYIAASGRYLVLKNTLNNGLDLYDLVDRELLEVIVPIGQGNLPDGLSATTDYYINSDSIDGDLVSFGVSYLGNKPYKNDAIYIALLPEPASALLFGVGVISLCRRHVQDSC